MSLLFIDLYRYSSFNAFLAVNLYINLLPRLERKTKGWPKEKGKNNKVRNG